MAQELDAESVALVRAFDDAGDIGDDEAAVVVHFHDAQIRFERGEGIIGDLGSSGGDDRDERAFAGVREADQANVGKQFQFEAEMLLFAGAAVFMFRGA